VIELDREDTTVFRRIARRVEDILEAARERERKGQTLALDIDARFRLEDTGAVQFQVASAILEEAGGLSQEEVVTELLSLGLASVLNGAAKAAAANGLTGSSIGLIESEDEEALPVETSREWPLSTPIVVRTGRVLN
jgi:hypothetical protein